MNNAVGRPNTKVLLLVIILRTKGYVGGAFFGQIYVCHLFWGYGRHTFNIHQGALLR